MSTPSAPPPDVPDLPAVPYGPGDTGVDASPAPPAADLTIERAARGFGGTALKWGIRILLPLLLRALFRALSRR
ncbi:MAG TPA: hypothetical protein PLZ93_24485 [Nocardioides sp.]|uniref:hypothetical protein n=1 Tax=uncultured Nocardioides sp. TaxID=198441 RepID=UPI000EEE667E|nr:hypothetical protein [uncultured Nocardioides sp.]HCB07151.1 hypothetical protein [Nocardioides sp.]HRD63370.1 hypothetical protein [Nocardioides sp.]HRI98806.1 hypothetical protein [Nocardioides sp.]HRK48343.1 hypothetical protein [Nocardioides sp.]